MSLQWLVRFWQGGGFVVPSFSWADDSTWADSDVPTGDGDEISGFGLADFTPAAAYYPDEMVKFIPGAPGELTIDAGHGMAAFPVPDSTLVFGSEDEFRQFMTDTFNAEFPVDPDTGHASLSLSVTVIGIPYATDSAGTTMVEVDDPIDTFLGGPNGFYVVGDRIICVVDPSLCPVECGDSSAPAAMPVSTLSLAGQEVSPPHLMAAPTAAPQHIGISTFVWRDFINKFGDPAHYTIWVETEVFPKPYEVFKCGPSRIATIGDIMVRVPGICSSTINNPNQVELELTASTSDFRTCRLDVIPLAPEIHKNLTKVRHLFPSAQYGRGPAYTGMLSEVAATNPSGASTSGRGCWATGCYTSDPCK